MKSPTRLVTIANRVGDAVRVLRGMAQSGREYQYTPNLDSARERLTQGLDPQRLMAILRNGDEGQITDALQLFEEIERSDPRFYSAANTRRLALTGLDWDVTSASDVKQSVTDKVLAEEATAFVREQLDNLHGFDCALEHMATALGPNLSVIESVWESNAVIDLVPIPHPRLTMDLNQSRDVRVITTEERTGVVAESPKWLVHIPNAKGGSPICGSLSRSVAVLFLIKRLALADWAGYVELFGIPMRIGKYQPNASSSEKKALLAALKALGSSFYGAMSVNAAVEIVESSQRGTSPHEALINYCNREVAIAFLGGNLTSDTTGGTGTFAAATVQDNVRTDLRDDDIRREGRTLRDQLLGPMVELQFPGRAAPVPYFRRIKPETIDRIKESTVMMNAQRLGMDVPTDWAYKTLGIPKPQVDDNDRRESVLQPIDAFEDGLTEGGNSDAF